MLTIGSYTANFDDARTPRYSPRKGEHVRVSESADAREWDAFQRRLKENRLDLDFVRWMPRLKMDVYCIVSH